MEKINSKKVLDSAKTMGIALAGFIAGNAGQKAVNKDGWKINALGVAISLLLHSWMFKKQWQKDAALGLGVYFGVKTANSLTAEVVNGLAGVPDGVKNIINKYVPRLSGADEDFSGLDSAEAQILLGYTENLGMNWKQAAASKQIQPNNSAVSKLLCRPVNGLSGTLSIL